MKRYKGIFMTDQKSAEGKRFSTGALFDAIYCGSKESTPTCLSHDSHRIIGWSRAEGLYVAPDMDCVTGNTCIVETDDEIEKLNQFREIWKSNQVATPFNKYGKDFIELLHNNYLVNENTKGYVHYCSILMYGYEGIVGKAFPDLIKNKDKYGQIKLEDITKDFDYMGAGVFKHKRSDFAILLHPYLRKSLSRLNNYNLEFLESFFSYLNSKDVSLKISIDEDFVGYAPSFLMPFEFEYIYGAPFDDDVSKIKQGPSCYDNTKEDHQYYQSLRTEYNWKWENGEFTFEMEDVNDYCVPGTLNKDYGCYYIHSQYDFANKAFKHFDGAVREYSDEEMLERIDQKLTESGKNKKYTKLFRLDGKISIHEWKDLILKFTYGLPSVYEYFGQHKPELHIGEEEPKPAIYNYVPYKLNENDGVRLYVAFVPDTLNNKKRWIDSFDEATTTDAKKYRVIEEKVKDLIQYLNNHNIPIEERQDCKYIDASDNYVNVPVIAHGNALTLQNDINQTWKGIKSYVVELSKNAKYMTYAFTLAWNMNGRRIQFGFAGNVVDLMKWMKKVQDIPVEETRFRKWLEQQSKAIHKDWPEARSFEREKLINEDGILYFKRRNVLFDAEFEELKVNGENMLAIKTDNPELKELILKGMVFISPAAIDGEWLCCNWSTIKNN